MNVIEALFIFIIGIVIGGALGALVMLMRTRTNGEADIKQRATTEAQIRFNQQQLESRGQELNTARSENNRLLGEVARLQQTHQNDIEKQQWIEQAETKLRDAFEALSGKSLQSNSSAFMENARRQLASDLGTQRTEMRGLVDPLQQYLGTLDQRIRELEAKREGAYQRMDETLQHLMKANTDLKSTTTTLAEAMKSSAKRGLWGELQLRRIAEMSDMHEHIVFEEQVNVEDGRPDMLVYLPNGGAIPIDSKTPMTAFIESVETNDNATRNLKIQQHVKAMRGRVNELSQKKYWEKIGHAADFVVMFVPSEACLSAAFDADPVLMEYALNMKVMVVTPITLLALLKTVAYGWQQHHINEEAMVIANEGREFYKRLKVFVEHLESMRGSLSKTVDFYNKAIGSLENRLLPSVRNLERMANTGKALDAPAMVEISTRQLTDGTHSLT